MKLIEVKVLKFVVIVGWWLLALGLLVRAVQPTVSEPCPAGYQIVNGRCEAMARQGLGGQRGGCSNDNAAQKSIQRCNFPRT